jgi:hypothetical protein
MKAAIVDSNNTVVNIIVWDETCVAPDGAACVVLPDDFHVSIGWVYNGEQSFTDPNPPAQTEAPTAPTLQELQAQLASLQAQISSALEGSR